MLIVRAPGRGLYYGDPVVDLLLGGGSWLGEANHWGITKKSDSPFKVLYFTLCFLMAMR